MNQETRTPAPGSGSRKYFTPNRVLQVLEVMKVPTDEFLRLYDSISRSRKIPTETEIAAVERFLASGDLKTLRQEVQRKDPSSIDALMTRVLVMKARGVEGLRSGD